jgi:hypothetical protein
MSYSVYWYWFLFTALSKTVTDMGLRIFYYTYCKTVLFTCTQYLFGLPKSSSSRGSYLSSSVMSAVVQSVVTGNCDTSDSRDPRFKHGSTDHYPDRRS